MVSCRFSQSIEYDTMITTRHLHDVYDDVWFLVDMSWYVYCWWVVQYPPVSTWRAGRSPRHGVPWGSYCHLWLPKGNDNHRYDAPVLWWIIVIFMIINVYSYAVLVKYASHPIASQLSAFWVTIIRRNFDGSQGHIYIYNIHIYNIHIYNIHTYIYNIHIYNIHIYIYNIIIYIYICV